MLNIITDMKRIVKWSLNFTIAMFLFSSCSQKLSLTKRHYTNGYYVESKKRINSEGIALNQKYTYKSNLDLKTNLIVEHAIAKPILGSINTNKIYHTNIDKSTHPSDKLLYRKNSSSVAKDNLSIHNNNLLKFKINDFGFLNQSLAFSKDETENGLSLFWIVILILLLLWLFGYIILSGGLINLVLALALLLLILWLLRII